MLQQRDARKFRRRVRAQQRKGLVKERQKPKPEIAEQEDEEVDIVGTEANDVTMSPTTDGSNFYIAACKSRHT